MTFDTFDSYNTDEAYKDKGTTAKGLVDAYKKDNPNGSADDFYAKLNKTWAQDKDGYVKKAVNEAFKVKEEPKKEDTPKVEEKPTEKVKETETTKNETTSNVNGRDEAFIEQTSGIADTAEDRENERQKELEEQRWNETLNRMKKSGEAFKNIDDHMVEQFPTFMFKRYADGEFGDPKSSDAKLRLAHFMLNGVQTKLRLASNLAMANAGKAPQFTDTTSDWDKYQQTNLAQGMENRWNKYKQDTQAAIDLAVKEGADEQELQSSVAKISSSNRLNTAFNMMNENQKVYTLRVLSKIGNEIGNMNNKDFVNTLIGFATSGNNLEWQEAAELLIARFGKDALSVIKTANENGETEEAEEQTAGVFGNLQNYKTIDGDTVNFDMVFTQGNGGKEKLQKLAQDLSNKYYNDEIDEETFRKYYQPLYEEGRKHTSIKVYSPDDVLKKNNENKIKDTNAKIKALNEDAKKGNLSTSNYAEQYAALEEKLKGYGATKIEKKLDNKAILKAIEKKNKK